MTKELIAKLAIEVSKNIGITQKEVLTLDEAAQYAGISKSAIYKLTFSRTIPYSKPNGKNCFIRRADLENWLMSNPVATDAELNARAMAISEKLGLPRRR